MDKGFSQIYHIFKKKGITVVIIRVNQASPFRINNILNEAQKKIDLKTVNDKLIIISKNKIRVIT
jgi:hypothetical protein